MNFGAGYYDRKTTFFLLWAFYLKNPEEKWDGLCSFVILLTKPVWLGSKQCNIYYVASMALNYVISGNVFLVGFLWSCLSHV